MQPTNLTTTKGVSFCPKRVGDWYLMWSVHFQEVPFSGSLKNFLCRKQCIHSWVIYWHGH